MLAGPPAGAVPAPDAVRAVAGRAALTPVWRNELGGLTWRVGERDARRFLKWAPAGSGLELGGEAERLAWAARYTVVPRVLDHGRDAEGEWLLTAAVPGESAVSDRWRRDPARAVAAVGAGLRALHDALPVRECPFDWSVTARLAEKERCGLSPERWDDAHRRLSVHEVRARLAMPPAEDRLVVCHGDACAPNTLLMGDGRWSGHVDVGSLGVADRWADLAVASWSTVWNYGPGWEEALFNAYGADPDPERISYYRLLWDVGP